MDGIYRAFLKERRPLDAALQRSQVASIRAGSPPREWAPLVVTGRVDAAAPARGVPLLAGAGVGLAAAALLAGAAAISARRRRRAS